MIRNFLAIWITASLSIATANADQREPSFAFKDGDTVAFLGDSITAAAGYTKIIEDYTLMRFPERKVRFMNVARGGETAQGSLDRLKAAVLDRKVTVLTVAYGINDIGWGTKADAEHEAAYLGGLDKIIDRCQAQGIRVYICSAAITAGSPDEAENGFLQKMCDKGLSLAKKRGAGVIDLMRSMREVQRRIATANANEKDASKHILLHASDGIHLNDLGQMAMAWAMLKGLGAPADSSSVKIDASRGGVLLQDSCKISEVDVFEKGVRFVRLDDRLPFNLYPLWVLMGWHIPISQDLNRYDLAVVNLEPGKYRITAGGRDIGTWSAEELAKGVNLASASSVPGEPGGPWQIQGQLTASLTEIRSDLEAVMATGSALIPKGSEKERIIEKIRSAESEVVSLQREMAAPIPLKFEVKKLE